jgi:cyclophilin family peptidyl-prolyl cis-trans isomerase
MPATEAAKRRYQRPTGFWGFVSRYPLASGFFTLILVGGIVGALYVNHVGPFALPPVHPCNLKTHVCAKPAMTISKTKLYEATIKTTKGNIVIDLDAQHDPITVNNFVYLADNHYYDGMNFCRIEQKGKPSPIDGTPSNLDLIQGGDPQGTATSKGCPGSGASAGPGYSFQDETVVGEYTTGAVAMANSGPNTNGSQFFICTGDDSQLPKSYNLFGQVVSGLDVAQKMTQADKITTITIAVKPLPPTPTAGPATPTATATAGK